MTSSNRHWPSMFRSNPACDFQQPDMNNSSLLSSPASGNKPSLISSEESPRNPEPKPRWNPRPEQIRILEGIFNSGMVNPPRDEIRRIRLQLQEYGQVGDANVFYWFQNRKSRTKNKLRAAGQLQPAGRLRGISSAPVTPPRHLLSSPLPPTSSSSSSSDRSSGSSKSVKPAALASAAVAAASLGMLPSTAINLFSPAPAPPLSAYQLYYHIPPMSAPATAPAVRELVSLEPPILQQWPQSQYHPATELGGILGSHAHSPDMYPAASVSPGVLLSLCNEALGQEIVDMSCSKGIGQSYFNTTSFTTEPINSKTDALSAVIREDERARLQGLLHYGLGVSAAADDAGAVSAPLAAPVHAAAAAGDLSTVVLPSAGQSNSGTTAAVTDQLQGLLDAGLMGGAPAPPTATVVAVAARDAAVLCAGATAQYYSVPAMVHLDVKLFGQAAVLLGHTGEPVLLDDSGVTVEPLQQGALYYVLVAN